MLVQFGNNWIQKIPRTAKLDSAVLIPRARVGYEMIEKQIMEHTPI